MNVGDIQVGARYLARIHGRLSVVRIEAALTTTAGRRCWDAQNETTGRYVRIKSAQKLRRPATARDAELCRELKQYEHPHETVRYTGGDYNDSSSYSEEPTGNEVEPAESGAEGPSDDEGVDRSGVYSGR